jgi:hypothetical protein
VPPSDAGSVFAVRKAAHGSFVDTVYDPAPGVSAVTLAASLRDAGIAADAVQPAVLGASKATCAYGSARTWGCPMATWPVDGRGNPDIYFINHTSSAWQVSTAASYWDRTTGLNVSSRTAQVGCPVSAIGHCAKVFDANYGASGWTGQTSRTVNSSNHITSATTKLNDYYRGTAAQHRNTACHEMGHVLGLDHNKSSNSCLYAARTSVQVPDNNDFSLLEIYY